MDTNIFNNTNKKINPKLVLNFLIERSGIIREPEDGIIDFVHKTFMEFLAVKTICRNCAWNELIKEACNPNWKETIIMCFHEMGPESVKLVLNAMLEKGKNLMDDRYILIASLCASNAVFLSDNELRLKIDNNIKTVIPPKSEQIIELSQAGNYILPFLKDSEAYTDAERMQCLELMDYIGTDEVIPILLSYLRGNGSNYIKTCALFILSEYNNIALEEFNVRDELLIELENSVKDELLITYESVLNILSNVKLGQQKADFLGNVKKIQVNCGTSNDSLYAGEMNFLRYLQNCSYVELNGNVYQINFLNRFPNIEELLIETKDDLSGAIQELAELKTLNNVKKLIISAGSLNYFCENDIRHMKNLETLEIYCRDEEWELNFNDLNQFTSLKKLVLGVDYDVYETLEEKIQHLKINNNKLEVLYSICEERYDIGDNGRRTT